MYGKEPRYNEPISPVPWHFVKSRFYCTYVELLAVPTASLISNPGHLSTDKSVFVGKKKLNTMCALENNSKVKAAVEVIDASLHLFGEDSAL